MYQLGPSRFVDRNGTVAGSFLILTKECLRAGQSAISHLLVSVLSLSWDPWAPITGPHAPLFLEFTASIVGLACHHQAEEVCFVIVLIRYSFSWTVSECLINGLWACLITVDTLE